jgi:RNA polymerase sigma-70 factor (ECF subfamily)
MESMVAKKEAERKQREEALASLYEGYYDKIVRYIFIRVGNQQEAEDLASEVFLKALKSLDSYQERGLPMEAWLFKIAHNLVVDYLRKGSKHISVPLEEVEIADTANTEGIVESRLQLEKLSEALKRLPPAQREVIGLRFIAGLTSVEAGKIMGKSPGALREMQSLALKSLRRALDEESRI